MWLVFVGAQSVVRTAPVEENLALLHPHRQCVERRAETGAMGADPILDPEARRVRIAHDLRPVVRQEPVPHVFQGTAVVRATVPVGIHALAPADDEDRILARTAWIEAARGAVRDLVEAAQRLWRVGQGRRTQWLPPLGNHGSRRLNRNTCDVSSAAVHSRGVQLSSWVSMSASYSSVPPSGELKYQNQLEP